MNRDSAQDISMIEAGSKNPSDPRPGWVAGMAFVVLLGFIILFVADRLYHPQKFRIEEVEVHGQFNHVDGDQVKQVVETSLDGNYFSASLEGIEQSVRDMPWVFDASVRRQWPSTLIVEIVEIQPIAEWGDDEWLNSNGDLVSREPWDGNLPILAGPESMQEMVWKAFQEWHGMFAAHGLSLDRLEFDQRELWYLTLSLTALALDRNAIALEETSNESTHAAEVTMIVDNSDATARIERLINALNTQLIAEFPGMKSIDLRYPNGFAINWIKQSPETKKLTESE
ncbi:MAG: FtsQ-type POTRA domain-containing protein [Arenicellales bacterium]